MSCLESRRSLLTRPRGRSAGLCAHIATCAACSRFASTLAALDRDFDAVLLAAVPDGISDRVLWMGRRERCSQGRRWRHGIAAAAVAIAAASSALWLTDVHLPDGAGRSSTITVVGAAHPAVAAIAEAAHETRAISRPPPPAAVDISRGFRRLGLTAPTAETRADYVGPCHIGHSSECAHVVLTTGGEQASVMLIANYPVTERVLVSDRRTFALMNSAGGGAYIVVAASAATAMRMERLLVNG